MRCKIDGDDGLEVDCVCRICRTQIAEKTSSCTTICNHIENSSKLAGYTEVSVTNSQMVWGGRILWPNCLAAMPSKASSRHDTIYSHVQYLGCQRMKYNEDAASMTRVYPMIFGMKRKTALWFTSLDRRVSFGFATLGELPFLGVPFCVRGDELGILLSFRQHWYILDDVQ